MNKLKFSHDYCKLPPKWEGTQAALIGVQYIADMAQFKRRLPQLIKADIEFRGEPGSYDLTFKEGILLTFFHPDSGRLFTTIRRYTNHKMDYYRGEQQEMFELVGVSK